MKGNNHIGDTPIFHWTMIMGEKGKPCQQIHSLLGDGNSNIFNMFIPKFGEESHFDEYIFQMGWFNHQLEDTVDGRNPAPPGMVKNL